MDKIDNILENLEISELESIIDLCEECINEIDGDNNE